MKINFLRVFIIVSLGAIIVLLGYFTAQLKHVHHYEQNLELISCKSYMPCKVSNETKQLSLQLNKALMEIGKLTCEASKDDVSKRGGWCSKISGKKSPLHVSDFNLANEMSKILKRKSVASFGDGTGLYKVHMMKLGEVTTYDAFDGAPYTEETSNGDVKHLDLSAPIYHLPLYDWVISLEVAEHIPKEYEQIFIDNLTRHAKEGIILSWAPLGLSGHSHVNNQNSDYVENELFKRGFKINQDLTETIQDACTFEWLKHNTYVYKRIYSLEKDSIYDGINI